MSDALQAVYLFWLCWLLAKLEIHIEGDGGWAVNLPTWRWAPPIFLRLTNGKPLTGYHVFCNALLLSLLHVPAVYFGWSRALEAKILASYFFMTVFWDFQWFVWNPAWGVKRYFSDKVWWLPTRVGGIPPEYVAGIAASFAFMAAFDLALWRWWTTQLIVLLALTLATVALSLARPSISAR